MSLKLNKRAVSPAYESTVADPRFLERGFICIKVYRGVALLNFSHFSEISHEIRIISPHSDKIISFS